MQSVTAGGWLLGGKKRNKTLQQIPQMILHEDRLTDRRKLKHMAAFGLPMDLNKVELMSAGLDQTIFGG